MNNKTAMKISNMTRLMSILLFGFVTLTPSVVQASEILPIGVTVELSSELISSWSNAEKKYVVENLTRKHITELKQKHQHWEFVSANTTDSPFELAISVISRGPKEILLEILLRVYRPATTEQPAEIVKTFELSDVVLYPPGHFDIYGWPSSTEAEAHIWDNAWTLIKDRREDNENILFDRVPVAHNPTRIQIADRSLVLPLPKERYAHLAWSEFRLYCKAPNATRHTKLSSIADNEWRVFDASLQSALTVVVTNELSDSEIRALIPERVYIQKYIEPDLDWLIFQPTEAPQ